MNFNMFGFSGGTFICKKARKSALKMDGEGGGLDKRERNRAERENRGVPETDVTLTAD